MNWTEQHQLILNKILDILNSPELISFPEFEKPFIVYCDASETGLGAVLCQNQDGKLKFISYASKTLTPAEKNYHLHSGKLEFLALKWAITDRFRDYLLYGSPLDGSTGLRWVADLANFKLQKCKTKMQIISPGTPYTKLNNYKRTVLVYETQIIKLRQH